MLRRLVLAALLTLVAGSADASHFGARRALLPSTVPVWQFDNNTAARNFRELAAGIALRPAAVIKQIANYNAGRFAFNNAVILTNFTGTFDGQNHAIVNMAILSASTTAQRLGLFDSIGAAATVKNLSFVGGFNISTGTSAADHYTLIGHSIGALVGINSGTIQNISSTLAVLSASSASRVGGIVGFNQPSGAISGLYCNNSVSLTPDGANTYLGNCVAYTWGLVENAIVPATAINFAPSGNTNTIPTGACDFTPPCPTTGAWQGGLVGAVGDTTGTFATAILQNSYALNTIVGSANVNAGNFAGGAIGNVLSGQVIGVYATGSVSGGSSVGGLVGRVQTSDGLVQQSYATGNVSGVNNIGGLIGDNGGAVSVVYATGNVTGTSTDVGGLIGLSRSTGVVDHGFSFGTAISSSSNGSGGAFGQSQGTVDQVYALGVPSGTAIVGGFIGFDSNDAGVTNSYWNTTTSGLTRGAGNVTTPGGITGRTTAQLLAAIPAGFDGAWVQSGGVAGGYPHLSAITAPAAPVPPPAPVITLLTTPGSSCWTVPADWNNSNNYVEAIGEGGNGGTASVSTGGRGGGSGAYAKRTNVTLTPLDCVPYTIGAGGSSTNTQFKDGATVVAAFGTSGSTAATGTGGTVANSVGGTRFAGANGGVNTNSCAGGGGAGAGGRNGNGKAAASAAGNASTCGGGGAGASSGGAVGVAGSTAGGGNGGDAVDGTAGGAGSAAIATPGGAGSNTSGGGGGFATTSGSSVGGAGSNGITFGPGGTAGAASGGGGGGGLSATATGAAGGNGGLCGGGGGGGGRGTVTPGAGGTGGGGCINIVYTPAS